MMDEMSAGSNDAKKKDEKTRKSRIALIIPDAQHQPLAYTEPKAAQK